MQKKEYGGFLPIELNPGREHFFMYEDFTYRFNSVKASLHFLIKHLKKKSIYIPYYYCPSTIEAIKKTGVSVKFYHIDKSFMPANLPDEKDNIVLLVDYFGVCTDLLEEIVKTYNNSEVIIDKAHAFFTKPIIRNHTHNLYSAKKFFGIPDGSYLISSTLFEKDNHLSYANGYANYLLKAYEEGTNSVYAEKKEIDKILADNYGNMSSLSIGLLQNVDYDRVEARRTRNYRTLYGAFSGINELTVPKRVAAYQFPLLLSVKGSIAKKKLIEKKIFVSTLWAGHDLKVNGNGFELNMMENGVFLPIDQRYNDKDMEYIINCVHDAMK